MVVLDSKSGIFNNQGGHPVALMTKLLKPVSTIATVLYWPTVTAHPCLRWGRHRPHLNMEGQSKNAQPWFKNHHTCTKTIIILPSLGCASLKKATLVKCLAYSE